MPTRTYLTTPPGRTPSEVSGRSASELEELYSPALAPPREPRVPARWQRPLLTLGVVLALLLISAAIINAVLSSQTQDPSLFDPSLLENDGDGEGPSLRDDPTVPQPPADEGGLPAEG